MDLADDLVLPRIRCAAVHGSTGADPGGTAPFWQAVLVVAVPLPWPREVSVAPPFDALGPASGGALTGTDGRRWRAQAVVPHPSDGDAVRVTAWERSVADGATTGPFVGREWRVPDEDTAVELCRVLLAGDAPVGTDEGAEAAGPFPELRDDPGVGTVDLYLCTHGARDTCCGGSGAATYAELETRLDAEDLDAEDAEGLRLRRTSHTGGHRFAPTGFTMPDGLAWSHLTAEVAERVLRRRGAAADVAAHCRGSVGLDAAVSQVADREGLRRVGWDWCAVERRAVVVAHERDTLATTVRVQAASDAATSSALEVRVELAGTIPMPTCGVVDGPEFATEPVWRVARSQ